MNNIIKKLKRKNNTKNLKNESLKEELLQAYRNIDKKNQTIIELLYLKEEKENKIKELLEENKNLREKKTRKVK